MTGTGRQTTARQTDGHTDGQTDKPEQNKLVYSEGGNGCVPNPEACVLIQTCFPAVFVTPSAAGGRRHVHRQTKTDRDRDWTIDGQADIG